MMQERARSLAAMYTRNDHRHCRLPVYTSHSKSRVVKYSHLKGGRNLTRKSRRSLHVKPRKRVHDLQEMTFAKSLQSALMQRKVLSWYKPYVATAYASTSVDIVGLEWEVGDEKRST